MTYKEEHNEHCKSIAETLSAYVDGRMVVCPECGERFEWFDEYETENPNCLDYWETTCPHCGQVAHTDDFEQLGLYDYLEEVYDVEFTLGSDFELRSARFMVACGGPNIYLDTKSGDVELYWWSEAGRYPMDSDAIEALDEYARELMTMR